MPSAGSAGAITGRSFASPPAGYDEYRACKTACGKETCFSGVIALLDSVFREELKGKASYDF